MNENDQPNDTVADRNVEQLLTQAYRPETPDAEFVRRLEDRMLAEAQRREDAPTVSPDEVKPWSAWQVVAAWVVVASVLIAAAWFTSRPVPPPTTDESTDARGDSTEYRTRRVVRRADTRADWVGDRGLTPRIRPAAPKQ